MTGTWNNSLEVYELDLQYSESIALTASDEIQSSCRHFGLPSTDCVTNIEAFSDTEITVCGTTPSAGYTEETHWETTPPTVV